MNSIFEVWWPETKGRIALPGPGLLWGPARWTRSFPDAAGGHGTEAAKLFKAPLTSDAQILPSERSSKAAYEVSIRPWGAALHKKTHRVFRMDFEELDKPMQSPKIVNPGWPRSRFSERAQGTYRAAGSHGSESSRRRAARPGLTVHQGRAERYGHRHTDLGVSGQQVQHIPRVHSSQLFWTDSTTGQAPKGCRWALKMVVKCQTQYSRVDFSFPHP